MYLILNFYPWETPVVAERDPGAFLYEVKGDVLSVAVRQSADAEDEARELVGKFAIYYADVDASVDAGISPLDMLHSAPKTAEYYEPVCGGPGGRLVPELERLLGEVPANRNLLILDRLEILPKFRGRNIGLLVLRRLLQRFSAGVGVAGTRLPVQAPAAAQVRLERYWAGLGFRRLGETGLMFRSAGQSLASVDALLRARTEPPS